MRHFVLLAYAITWLAVSPLVGGALGLWPMPPAWLHALGALGPVLAAGVSRREHGLFQRRTQPSLSRPWLAACLATPALLAAAGLLAAAAQGTPLAPPLQDAIRDPGWVAGLVVASVAYGLGEEPGWRGWLLPELQRRMSPVRATLVLTGVWSVWHTPLFFYRYDFQGPATVIAFFVALLAGAFWLTFLFNASGGSIWTVAAWHVLWNAANLTLAEVSDTAVGVLNALMMVLGFGVLTAFARRGLSVDGKVIRAGPA